MKRAKMFICMAAISLLAFSGCGKTESKDSYVEGSDYQYQFYDRNKFTTNMAKGKEDTFIKNGRYIYRIGENGTQMSALCNKTNCLHDQETDRKKAAECNAYIDSPDGASGLAYMNGYIYFVGEEALSGVDTTDVVWKISEDGATREKVYQWDKKVVEGSCFHRNTLYYVEHSYNESNEESYVVKELKLDGIGKTKPKTIFTPDKNVTIHAFSTLQAFGNHIYINMDGEQADKTKNLTDEERANMSAKEWNKYSYNKTFQYNLMDEELTEIKVPEQSDSEKVSQITFWKNKIVFQAFDGNKSRDYDTKTNVYIANLDGTDAKVLLKDMPMYRWFTSDGNYLYVSDCPENIDKIVSSAEFKENSDTEQKLSFQFTTHVDVYDKDMKLIDSMVAPYRDWPYEPAYGIGDQLFLLQQNDAGDKMELYCWDKTQIGSYHGKKYEYKKICEQPISKLDMKEKEESGE